MRHDNSGAPRQPRGPAISELFARFPGPVAVVHDDVELNPMSTWQYHDFDDTPWALDAVYDRGNSRLLVVKSVRSPAELSTRGMPVESDAIQISNFLHHDEITADPGQYATGHQPDRQAHLDRYQRAQDAVEHTAPEPVTVSCDGVARPAGRVTALDCSVVRLNWDDNTIWCTGRPEIISRLALRTATVDDFRRATTE
jgi:hypothetical protein